jgi:hypothetical protein
MRSRISEPTSGWLVRSSDSVQPVHSWKCSQMTDGFFLPTFSAIFSPAHAGKPTAAAAVVQTLMKSRRETPLASCPITSEPMLFIPFLRVGGRLPVRSSFATS